MPLSTIRPPSMTSTCLAERIVLSLWAITNAVRPAIRFSSACWISISVRVSTLLVASSRIRMRGSARMARAIASNWRCPWLKLCPCSDTCVWYPCGRRRMNQSALASRAAAYTCSSVASSRP